MSHPPNCHSPTRPWGTSMGMAAAATGGHQGDRCRRGAHPRGTTGIRLQLIRRLSSNAYGGLPNRLHPAAPQPLTPRKERPGCPLGPPPRPAPAHRCRPRRGRPRPRRPRCAPAQRRRRRTPPHGSAALHRPREPCRTTSWAPRGRRGSRRSACRDPGTKDRPDCRRIRAKTEGGRNLGDLARQLHVHVRGPGNHVLSAVVVAVDRVIGDEFEVDVSRPHAHAGMVMTSTPRFLDCAQESDALREILDHEARMQALSEFAPVGEVGFCNLFTRQHVHARPRYRAAAAASWSLNTSVTASRLPARRWPRRRPNRTPTPFRGAASGSRRQ